MQHYQLPQEKVKHFVVVIGTIFLLTINMCDRGRTITHLQIPRFHTQVWYHILFNGITSLLSCVLLLLVIESLTFSYLLTSDKQWNSPFIQWVLQEHICFHSRRLGSRNCLLHIKLPLSVMGSDPYIFQQTLNYIVGPGSRLLSSKTKQHVIFKTICFSKTDPPSSGHACHFGVKV